MNNDNPLLYDTDKERKLVGMFLSSIRDEYFPQCAEMLQPDDFEDDFCKDVWTVMTELSKKHSSLGAISVEAFAPSIGINLSIFDLASNVDATTVESPVELASHLADLAIRRKMQRELFRCALDMNNLDQYVTDIIDEAKHSLDGAVHKMPTDVSNMDVYRDSVNEWQARSNGDSRDGIMCGYHYIDNRGGLQPSDLDIIAGRTSAGKTALAINIILNAAMNGTPVGVISLEMSLKQLFARMTAIVSGVSSTKLQYARLDDYTFQIAFDGASKIAPLPIYYDSTRTSNIRMIESGIRRMKMNQGIKVALIDYAQLLTDPKAKDERTRVGGAANSLKALAVELDIVIILISQIRRLQGGQSPVPTISMLKESGDLENAADNIYLLYRSELYNTTYPDMSEQWSKYDPDGTALIINGKSRNAGIGEFLLAFDKELTKFSEITTPPLLTDESKYVAQEETPF